MALQAIEFWSTVCEEEIDLAIEAQEVSKALRVQLAIMADCIVGSLIR